MDQTLTYEQYLEALPIITDSVQNSLANGELKADFSAIEIQTATINGDVWEVMYCDGHSDSLGEGVTIGMYLLLRHEPECIFMNLYLLAAADSAEEEAEDLVNTFNRIVTSLTVDR